MPRLHCPLPLATGQAVDLPPGPARHVQVLRLQPGAALTLFDGRGGEYDAVVDRMGRSDVRVVVAAHHAIEREAACSVQLAIGVPANERMDWLVEKATELGVAAIQPLAMARSVVRLEGERAAKRQAHWQAIAVAACEQCGRNRVPTIHPVQPFEPWVAQDRAGVQLVLSTRPDAMPPACPDADTQVVALSGPEGGFTPEEEEAARGRFRPVSLGVRVLRADTAPIALLAFLTLAA
jgi:16S rRNA (uracil1498-N3)-methyltransferase